MEWRRRAGGKRQIDDEGRAEREAHGEFPALPAFPVWCEADAGHAAGGPRGALRTPRSAGRRGASGRRPRRCARRRGPWLRRTWRHPRRARRPSSAGNPRRGSRRGGAIASPIRAAAGRRGRRGHGPRRGPARRGSGSSSAPDRTRRPRDRSARRRAGTRRRPTAPPPRQPALERSAASERAAGSKCCGCVSIASRSSASPVATSPCLMAASASVCRSFARSVWRHRDDRQLVAAACAPGHDQVVLGGEEVGIVAERLGEEPLGIGVGTPAQLGIAPVVQHASGRVGQACRPFRKRRRPCSTHCCCRRSSPRAGSGRSSGGWAAWRRARLRPRPSRRCGSARRQDRRGPRAGHRDARSRRARHRPPRQGVRP